MSRLKDKYRDDVVPALMQKFGYKNIMQAPKIEKVIINMGLGEAIQNSKIIDAAVNDLMIITGQKPNTTKAKKSIAAFKLRAGMTVGAKVTLRGVRMYEFVDKLFSIALPRVRDFRGISVKSFDGRGNFSMGVREQLIFPEIDYDKIDKIRGMDIIFVTTAKTDEEAKELLRLMGMPFKAA
jgi:large subunit ribosomal protein L5